MLLLGLYTGKSPKIKKSQSYTFIRDYTIIRALKVLISILDYRLMTTQQETEKKDPVEKAPFETIDGLGIQILASSRGTEG